MIPLSKDAQRRAHLGSDGEGTAGRQDDLGGGAGFGRLRVTSDSIETRARNSADRGRSSIGGDFRLDADLVAGGLLLADLCARSNRVQERQGDETNLTLLAGALL
jgi:hypothetical protein